MVGAVLELERLGVSGPAAAARMRTVGAVSARTSRQDLVWMGPEVVGLHARDTLRSDGAFLWLLNLHRDSLSAISALRVVWAGKNRRAAVSP